MDYDPLEYVQQCHDNRFHVFCKFGWITLNVLWVGCIVIWPRVYFATIVHFPASSVLTGLVEPGHESPHCFHYYVLLVCALLLPRRHCALRQRGASVQDRHRRQGCSRTRGARQYACITRGHARCCYVVLGAFLTSTYLYNKLRTLPVCMFAKLVVSQGHLG